MITKISHLDFDWFYAKLNKSFYSYRIHRKIKLKMRDTTIDAMRLVIVYGIQQ